MNAVLLVTVNAVGIMAHHLGEKSQRESFINCRAYIGAKLQFQEQGQKLVCARFTRCFLKTAATYSFLSFLSNALFGRNDLTVKHKIGCEVSLLSLSYVLSSSSGV